MHLADALGAEEIRRPNTALRGRSAAQKNPDAPLIRRADVRKRNRSSGARIIAILGYWRWWVGGGNADRPGRGITGS